MIRMLAAGLMLLGSLSLASAQPHSAQQPPADPVVLQRALGVLEQQRNFALNGQANAETRALGLADENEKLKARLKALEEKAASKADTPPAEPAKKD